VDDGRPTPAAATHTVEAVPTTSKILVLAGIALAIAATVAAIVILATTGVGTAVLIVLIVPGLSLIWLLRPGSARPAERVSGWRNPTLEISPWPVRLGSSVTAVYRRQPVNKRTVEKAAGSIQLDTELICEEWVQYTVGTDTRTETDDVFETSWSEAMSVGEDGVEAIIRFSIPVDRGGPSIHLDHSRLRWRVDQRLGRPFGPLTETRIDLDVVSAIDRDAVLGEGTYDRGERR